MKKLALILLGAAIAFPLGAVVRDARGQDRIGVGGPTRFAQDNRYAHVEKANAALHDAMAEIAAVPGSGDGA